MDDLTSDSLATLAKPSCPVEILLLGTGQRM
jgi:uncharacterized protein